MWRSSCLEEMLLLRIAVLDPRIRSTAPQAPKMRVRLSKRSSQTTLCNFPAGAQSPAEATLFSPSSGFTPPVSYITAALASDLSPWRGLFVSRILSRSALCFLELPRSVQRGEEENSLLDVESGRARRNIQREKASREENEKELFGGGEMETESCGGCRGCQRN